MNRGLNSQSLFASRVRTCVWSRTQDDYNNKELYQAARYDSYPGPMFVRGTHSKGYRVVLKLWEAPKHSANVHFGSVLHPFGTTSKDVSL